MPGFGLNVSRKAGSCLWRRLERKSRGGAGTAMGNGPHGALGNLAPEAFALVAPAKGSMTRETNTMSGTKNGTGPKLQSTAYAWISFRGSGQSYRGAFQDGEMSLDRQPTENLKQGKVETWIQEPFPLGLPRATGAFQRARGAVVE